MQHHQPFAGGGEIEERLAILGRVEELPVHADDRHIGLADLGGSLIAILGVVHAEAGGAERGAVGAAEELPEVVRAAAADDEDLGLARRPDDWLGFRQGGIATSACLRPVPGGRRGLSELVEAACPEPVEGPGPEPVDSRSVLAVMATVTGTMSVSKLSSTIFDSVALLAEIQREVAQLAAAGEVAGVGAERHLGPAERVGEVLTVLEHVLLASCRRRSRP